MVLANSTINSPCANFAYANFASSLPDRRKMTEFTPDERQKRLIEKSLQAHRAAQKRGRFAPDRLVQKWSSEIGLEQSKSGRISEEHEERPNKAVHLGAIQWLRTLITRILHH
jgi:hypothetical protein